MRNLIDIAPELDTSSPDNDDVSSYDEETHPFFDIEAVRDSDGTACILLSENEPEVPMSERFAVLYTPTGIRKLIKDLNQALEQAETANKSCKCEMTTLMRYGCTCNGK